MALRVAASRFATSIRPQAPVFARRTGAVRTMGSDPADLPTEGWEGTAMNPSSRAMMPGRPRPHLVTNMTAGMMTGMVTAHVT